MAKNKKRKTVKLFSSLRSVSLFLILIFFVVFYIQSSSKSGKNLGAKPLVNPVLAVTGTLKFGVGTGGTTCGQNQTIYYDSSGNAKCADLAQQFLTTTAQFGSLAVGATQTAFNTNALMQVQGTETTISGATVSSSGTTVTGSASFTGQVVVGDTIKATVSGTTQVRKVSSITSTTVLVTDTAFSPVLPAGTTLYFARPGFVVLNNGNVGIGQVNPQYPLSVGGVIQSTSGGFKFPDNTTQITAAGGGSQWTTSASNIYYNTGNVGIGTTGPAVKLESYVNAAADTVALRLSNADTNGFAANLEFWSGNGGGKVTSYIRSQASGSNGGFLDFQVRDQTANALQSKMFITNAGNVGIGTTGPTYKLEVNGATKTTGSDIFAQSDNTTLNYTAAPIQLREAQYGASGAYLAPRISFHWGGVVASQIGIESSGRLAILNNPGTGYENLVANTITATSFSGSGTGLTGNVTHWDTWYGATYLGSGGGCGFTGANGLLIFNSSCDYSLAYISDYSGTMKLKAGATTWFQLTTSGSTIGGNVAYTNWSDGRLKQNITPLGNSLDVINKLQGISFNWKDPANDQRIQYGFVAQDVEKVLPSVITDMNGYKGLTSSELIPFLVEGIKEQQKEIDSLKATVEELKNK